MFRATGQGFFEPKWAVCIDVCVCVSVYVPLYWGLLGSAITGPDLLPQVPVSRLFRATSRLLLLSIRACRAASLLKPISMMSLRARSSTYTQVMKTERRGEGLHGDQMK